MTQFHHILVPVDFEVSSRKALDVATDLAITFDARLTVLHVWDIVTYAYGSYAYLNADVWSQVEDAAKKQLDATVTEVKKRLPRAEGLLARGPAALEVMNAVDRLKADLVVIGTHGRSGLSRMLLGSVAEKIVRGSSVPVLTVRGALPA